MSEHENGYQDEVSDDKRVAIAGFCQEMSASMTRRKAETEFQREAVKLLVKKHEDLDKKVLRKMARVFHDSRFSTIQAENDEFESLYQDVFKDNAI